MEDKSKTPNRVHRYIEKQKERGMVMVNVWVPKEYTHAIRKLAYQLRKQSGFETHRGKIIYGELNEEV